MHMRLLAIALAVATCNSAGAAARSDPERWVVELGGSVARDEQGRLVEIDLRGSWVTDLELTRLAAASGVRELDLSRTHISDVALQTIARLPELRSLNLRFCEHITEAGVAHLRNARNLERLDLRGASVSDSGMAFLAQIPTLRWLDIGITQITGPSFEAIEALERLETLSIGGNRVSELGLGYLQALPRLRALDLSGSQITDSGVWGVTVTDVNLDVIAALTGLERLNLAASDSDYIANIGDGVPRLRNRIEITDLGAAKLTALTRLHALDLSRSDVTVKGLLDLASLPALETLRLAYASALDDDAVPAWLKMKRLRSLDLTGVRLTDGGLARLAEHPGLESLIVLDSKVTGHGAAEFRRRNPACKLIW